MTTLESRFEGRIREFARARDSLPALRAALDSSPEEDKLRERIVALESNAEEIEYLLRTAPYIREYATTTAAGGGSHGMGGFVHVTGASNRNNVFQRYLADVENVPEAIVAAGLLDPQSSDEHYACPNCQTALTVITREATLVCTGCGRCAAHSDDCGHLTYEQEVTQDVVKYFAYKRMNHFCEWLNSLQARENTEVPVEVVEAVKAEFKKARVSTRAEIKPTKVREFLKKLKLNKFYEHTHHICNVLNGVPAPKLPPELEERLKRMFAEIQEPFERACPPTRTNFLSYSYVLYKFCELLGEDSYLPLLPLLKSSEKLYAQDQIWRKICKELRWEFIRSV